jgi:hypothetical protein
MDRLVARDEREMSVDRAADRLAYLVLSFGLLVIVAYRSIVDGVASWERLALVLLGGAVGAIYRLSHGVLTRQAALVLAAAVGIAFLVAAFVALRLGS